MRTTGDAHAGTDTQDALFFLLHVGALLKLPSGTSLRDPPEGGDGEGKHGRLVEVNGALRLVFVETEVIPLWVRREGGLVGVSECEGGLVGVGECE